MQETETTCGQELARAAEVPELLGELWELVAKNLGEHARWVGTGSPEAAAEHDALSHLAREYRTIAAAAERAAAIMNGMHDLPAAPHEPARLDRVGQARFMRQKIALQLKLADLLVCHADESRAALVSLEAAIEE